MVTSAAFVATVVAAGGVDLRSRRIPNALSVGGLALALILRLPLGWGNVVDGLLGGGLGLALAFPIFLAGGLGGGDVKLLAAVGGYMGPGQLVGACLLIALLGGAFALADAARQGALRAVLLNVFYMLTRWMSPDRRSLSPTLTSPAAMSIPYGVPIAVGSLVWWFWGGSLV
ncbi:MAG: prepilin peptidase [Gemmatimonadales bacterium]